MFTKRVFVLLAAGVALVAAACASPTAPTTKGCDTVTMGSSC